MMKQSRILISRVLFYLILVSGFVCNAQLTDNFSDGDFTGNPAWSGTDNFFTIMNGQLRSNAGQLGIQTDYYLSTSSAKALEAQWEFFINLKFATSGVNYVDVYLVADQSNLLSPTLNGYFVRIGDTPDEVSLYKIVAGISTKIIDGTDGTVNSSSDNPFAIKVIRDGNNSWSLQYIDGLAGSYINAGTVVDNTFLSSAFFGIKIRQSSAVAPANNHYFDDFYVGDIIVDSEPPLISSATPLSSNQLDVLFNEEVDVVSAQTVTNYQVNNSVGQPTTATRQPDGKTVRLTFAQNFPNAINCQLTVTNVKDLFNNAITSTNTNFLFFQPVAAQSKDIIITEIFADPSPSVGLPDAEFVEIYNRSSSPFQLQNWKITDGNSTGTLPSKIIMPGEYIILCATASVTLFNSYGTALGVSNFPTLNNGGETLTLKDNTTVDVDKVTYSDAWYKDEDKQQGGYSLELIDPQNICSEEENWVSSEAINGGTPCSQNSVFANKPDLTGPKLLSAIPLSSTEILLTFNEKLDEQLPAAITFSFTPSISVTQVSFADAMLRAIKLDVAASLQSSTQYTVVATTVYDCASNLIQSDYKSAVFGLPQVAVNNDVVINELLFNPRPFGVDFVEVYNRSTKYINIKNWSVGNYFQGNALNLKTITQQDFLLAPGMFLVFSEDPQTVLSHYPKGTNTALMKVVALPILPDSEGAISLIDGQGNVIDYFTYTDDYHSVFLRDKEGVSLERISAEQGNSADNWKSASATEGFATPGYANSNSRSDIVSGEVVVTPEAFEPIIGQPDFTQIQYNFKQGGFVANIKIVDAQGRLIKSIANNTTLGTTGFFRWDGDTEDGTKARTGYYVVWLEVFNANGNVETFRKRVVIASRK